VCSTDDEYTRELIIVRKRVEPGESSERWPDLVGLFDRPIVRTCFCMYYRKTGTGAGVGAVTRHAMKALVDRGVVPGLIGYEERRARCMGVPSDRARNTRGSAGRRS
jgi:hypothetical protein